MKSFAVLAALVAPVTAKGWSKSCFIYGTATNLIAADCYSDNGTLYQLVRFDLNTCYGYDYSTHQIVASCDYALYTLINLTPLYSLVNKATSSATGAPAACLTMTSLP